MNLLLVAMGGAAGASARYLVGVASLRVFGPGFPWGTLIVNVLGSFAMGVVAVMLMERAGAWARYAPLVMTGVLGGFTTFSAFSLDALTLLERGRPAAAAGYVAASVLLSVGALWAGLVGARLIMENG